jgi:pimeloyl-ACP methyl ester carboxylesterase
MSVPLFAAPLPPTQLFEALSQGKFFYILYFQEVGPAEKELDADPRRTMARVLWSVSGDALSGTETLQSDRPREGTGFLDGTFDPPAVLPQWLTDADIDYYGANFAKSGFFGPLSFYRNLDANWELTKDIPGTAIAMPIGFIAGTKDPVIGNPAGLGAMESMLPDFRGSTLIEGAGHWVQQEKPDETNTALLAFLRGL